MSRVLALDIDALVHWAMAGAPHYRVVRRCLERVEIFPFLEVIDPTLG